MSCEEEQDTRHYRGQGFGFGPVRNEEIVMAGFSEQDFVAGQLQKKAFPGKIIKNGNFSLARLDHTTKEDFEKNVIEPKRNSTPITKVGRANVGEIRKLMVPLHWEKPTRDIRSVCVIDKVEEGDHDGHAALKYCEEQKGFTQNQLDRLRAHIAADLVHLFENTSDLDRAFAN